MKIDNNLKKVTFFIVFIGLLLVASSILLFVLLKNQGIEILELEKNTVEAESHKANSLTIKKLVESSEESRGKIRSIFITNEDDTVKFIERLEGYGEALDLKMQVDVSAVSTNKENDSLRFDVSASGPVNSLYNLLLLFENLPAKTKFGGVNLRLLSDNMTSVEKNWSARFFVDVESYINE